MQIQSPPLPKKKQRIDFLHVCVYLIKRYRSRHPLECRRRRGGRQTAGLAELCNASAPTKEACLLTNIQAGKVAQCTFLQPLYRTATFPTVLQQSSSSISGGGNVSPV